MEIEKTQGNYENLSRQFAKTCAAKTHNTPKHKSMRKTFITDCSGQGCWAQNLCRQPLGPFNPIKSCISYEVARIFARHLEQWMLCNVKGCEQILQMNSIWCTESESILYVCWWLVFLDKYGHLAVLPFLSAPHMDVFFPVSIKPPFSCLVSVFVNVTLFQCLSLRVCLSYVFVFSFLLSFSLLSFCHWPLLSPPSVKTPQEHHPVKFLLPANLLLLPLLSTRDSKRLLTLSFFVLLIICSHSCCIRLVLFFPCHRKTLSNTTIILSVFDYCLIWCPLLLLLLQKVHN